MNISDVAERSGLPAKTIRYYEDIGLIRPGRLSNGYRTFTDSDLHKLTFISRARHLGFPIEDCRALLALYEDDTRESSQVRHIAGHHLREIDEKIDLLRTIRATLAELVDACQGDHRPDCPILKGLSGEARLPQAE